MAKKINGQKQTSAVEVVFNTAKCFADKGIQFDGFLKSDLAAI